MEEKQRKRRKRVKQLFGDKLNPNHSQKEKTAEAAPEEKVMEAAEAEVKAAEAMPTAETEMKAPQAAAAAPQSAEAVPQAAEAPQASVSDPETAGTEPAFPGEAKVSEAEARALEAEARALEAATKAVGQVRVLEGQVAELKDRLLRQMAEFDNYRKRTTREKSQSFERGVRYVLDAMLPVLDNLERAMSSSTATEDPLYIGMRMTKEQMLQIFSKLGVTPIDDIGQTFDPHFHEALMHIDDATYGEQEIVGVFLKGYKLGDTVIRASLVKVAN